MMKNGVMHGHRICKLPGRLDGKLAVVTGATMGCGMELSGELARRGATVIMACRDLKKAEESKEILVQRLGDITKDDWKKTPVGPSAEAYIKPIKRSQLIIEKLDLASLKSIRKFAAKLIQTYKKIDYLVNNAGIMATNYMETEDGFELQIGVNHLGPFLLTELLLPLLHNGAPSRIIIVASNLYKQGEIDWDDINLRGPRYGPFKAYNQSKLANMLHVKGLAKRLDTTKIIPMAIHPGGVRTELRRDPNDVITQFIRSVGVSPWFGAQTALYTILCDNPVPGGYYSNCDLEGVLPKVERDADIERLWSISESLVGLKK